MAAVGRRVRIQIFLLRSSRVWQWRLGVAVEQSGSRLVPAYVAACSKADFPQYANSSSELCRTLACNRGDDKIEASGRTKSRTTRRKALGPPHVRPDTDGGGLFSFAGVAMTKPKHSPPKRRASKRRVLSEPVNEEQTGVSAEAASDQVASATHVPDEEARESPRESSPAIDKTVNTSPAPDAPVTESRGFSPARPRPDSSVETSLRMKWVFACCKRS